MEKLGDLAQLPQCVSEYLQPADHWALRLDLWGDSERLLVSAIIVPLVRKSRY